MIGEDQPGGGSGRRPYAKGIARRQQIIDQAIDEFAERGVDGTSLRTLGEAIGVSHTTLRHYFASRDELLVEVYRAHQERDDGAVPHQRTARDQGSALDQSDAPDQGSTLNRDPVGQMAASAERNRSIPGLVRLYATLTTDALQEGHPLTTAFIAERFAALRTALAGEIRTSQAAGVVAGDVDPVDAAALVIAASDGLQVQWLLDPDSVDVGRCLSLLERLLPAARGDDGGTSSGDPDDRGRGNTDRPRS